MFCKLHRFPIIPTTDILSFYVVFIAHHIKLTSVSQYLSGIVSSLEPHFLNVCKLRNSLLVSCTLASMKKLHGFTSTARKCTLNEEDLIRILMIFSLLFPCTKKLSLVKGGVERGMLDQLRISNKARLVRKPKTMKFIQVTLA